MAETTQPATAPADGDQGAPGLGVLDVAGIVAGVVLAVIVADILSDGRVISRRLQRRRKGEATDASSPDPGT
jgi:hypothetical protein